MERTQRTITRLFSITALVAAFATSFAQGGFDGPPQGGPGGPGGPGQGQGGPGGPGGPGQQFRMPRGPQLLRHPDVQKELKLSDDQMNAIDAAFPQLRGGQGGPGGQGGRGGSGGGAGGQGGAGGGQGGRGGQGGQGGRGGQGGGPGGPGGPGGQGGPNPQNDAKIKEILSPQQYSRFKQIEIQVVGPQAFMTRELGEKLNISEDQRDAIRDIMEEFRPEPGQPGQQPPDPVKQMKAVMAKVMSVLSEQQRAEYKALVGREFYLTTKPPMEGPGGQGGRPGGRPGGQGGPGGPPPPDGGN